MSLGGAPSEQLDRIASIQNAASESAGSSFRVDLKPPATARDIDRIESRLGSLLPTDVRDLFAAHDGCAIWIAPGVGFAGLERSLHMHSTIRDLPLPRLSNGNRAIDANTFFPILDMDKVLLAVATSRGPRELSSPLYLVDYEMDQLTIVARSVGDFISYLLNELDEGNFEVAKNGPAWKQDPLRFSRTMTPIGEASN